MRGRPLSREPLSILLKEAAVRVGRDPGRIGTHSLRAGGATALLLGGVPMDRIQLFGRWQSPAFLQYLWPQAEQAAGYSQTMAEAPSGGFLHPAAQSSDYNRPQPGVG